MYNFNLESDQNLQCSFTEELILTFLFSTNQKCESNFLADRFSVFFQSSHLNWFD
ncbi:hypothetical protein LEP1GSC172_2737 [Leptospira noguchii]|uniref:Uncharacterized protein n=2 Tax=Leptospira noguchii TaxID=28182 RepID=T0H1V6_9LEPT|nr:hypothetical protein LEP1GSC172_2737 [Leptospira noguchii]EQA73386.1 hypothetical protein LEP1GSC059_0420 [Leptospira noguchii serovar Panama str. CZ214]